MGYSGSVFNLVYVNNTASVRYVPLILKGKNENIQLPHCRIWESLGFTKAGRIPSAGRLKKKDGEGEEYVDAWVFYKDFTEE